MYIPVLSFDFTVGLRVAIRIIISEMFTLLKTCLHHAFNQENRLKSGQHHPKIWSTYRQQGGIFRLFLRTHFFAWSTCHKNLVNKLGFLVNLFCLRNPQNMSKKNRGKSLFPKLLPRISLIISIQSFILRPQLAPLLRGRWARGRGSSLRSSCQALRRTLLMRAHHHVRRKYRLWARA